MSVVLDDTSVETSCACSDFGEALQSSRGASRLRLVGMLCCHISPAKSHGSNCTELRLRRDSVPGIDRLVLKRYNIFSVGSSLELELLDGIFLQTWFLSCYSVHSIRCGFELIHWKIVWSLIWHEKKMSCWFWESDNDKPSCTGVVTDEITRWSLVELKTWVNQCTTSVLII